MGTRLSTYRSRYHPMSCKDYWHCRDYLSFGSFNVSYGGCWWSAEWAKEMVIQKHRFSISCYIRHHSHIVFHRIHCFDNVTAILFVVAISGYDQCLVEDRDSVSTTTNCSIDPSQHNTDKRCIYIESSEFWEKFLRDDVQGLIANNRCWKPWCSLIVYAIRHGLLKHP